MACHHARSSSSLLTRGRMRRPLNFPGTPHHWLGFLGCHSRPKEGVLPLGRIERSWVRKKGPEREDKS